VAREVVEEARAEHVLERGFSADYGVSHLAAWAVEDRITRHEDGIADGAGLPGEQRRAERVQREAAGRLLLDEHLQARERAEQPGERRGVVPLARASSSTLFGPVSS